MTLLQAMKQTSGGRAFSLYMSSAVPVCCPPQCIQLIHNNKSASSVYGSYPYSGSSSICLAAIHAGLISNEDGGWVFYNLFPAYTQPVMLDLTDSSADSSRLLVNGNYQKQAANISMLQLFPFNSSSPSYSNGVQSVAIDLHVNVTMLDYSFTVHSRGTHAGQRQSVPWSGRAGHTHAYGVVPSYCEGFHLIVGGHNATHYMNDVWLGEQLVPFSSSCCIAGHIYYGPCWPDSPPGFVQWYRLPDAPFTPRAHMMYTDDMPQPLHLFSAKAVFLGGQTGHHCGLRELAICSDEVWVLNITVNSASPTMGLSFNWISSPRLPFPARCGSAGVQIPGASGLSPMLVIGGQLNYTDANCLAPITHVNDVWFTPAVSLPNVSQPTYWTNNSAAPFSPRSSMIFSGAGAPPIPDYFPPGPLYSSLACVYGGVTYLNHTVNATTGRAVLTAVAVYADAYGCYFFYGPGGLGCSWVTSSDSQSSVLASLPVPAAGALPLHTTNFAAPTIFFGGRTSRQALLDWLNTVPPLYVFNNSLTRAELVANVTVIFQPYPIYDPSKPSAGVAPSLADVQLSRYQLPLMYVLDANELNDPTSPFNAGMSAVMIHSLAYPGIFSSFISSSAQQLQYANDSTIYIYQATDAVNSTRGLFQFSIRRHSYAAITRPNVNLGWADFTGLIVSGGRSADEYYADWIAWSYHCCMPPDDPGYRLMLGNGTFHTDQFNATMTWCQDAWNIAPVLWICAKGYHLEPAETAGQQQTEIVCVGDAMWVNAALGTVSTCVKNRLNCTYPFIDDGDEDCILPSPTIVSITSDGCTSSNAMTLIDCPISGYSNMLFLNGSYFTLPMLIYVGGVECTFPQLHDEHDNTICIHDQHNDTECVTYGTGVLCQMSAMVGYELPIRVFSGAMRQPSRNDPPFISFGAPEIVLLNTTDCPQRTSQVDLRDCPFNYSFGIWITGFNFMADDEALPSVTLGTYIPLTCSTHGFYICFPPDQLCQTLLCMISPILLLPLNTSIPILLRQAGGRGADNLRFSGTNLSIATVSFAACDAGTIDVSTSFPGMSPAMRCSPCPAGTSTNSLPNQPVCAQCAIGHYSAVNGSAACLPCPPDTYAPQSGYTVCLPCPPNSYQSAGGASECHICDLNQYLLLSNTTSSSGASCSACLSPTEALCLPNGTIISGGSSSYVLVDQETGTISSALCHSGRCMSGSMCLNAGTGTLNATNITRTNLSIINCCAAHRLAANINPLCAQCQDGYTEWDATCIRCDWQHVNVGALIGMILLAWILLWMLHRLPNDRYVATVSILFYFMQMTILFFSSQQLSPVLELFNLNLFGDWVERDSTSGSESTDGDTSGSGSSAFCLLPLSAMQKLVLLSFMPVFGVLLLFLIALLQLLSRQCLKHTTKQNDHPDWPENNNAHAHSQSPQRSPGLFLYQLLFGQDAATAAPSSFQLQMSLLSPASSSSAFSSSAPLGCSVSVLPYYRTLVRICVYGYNSMTVLTLSYFHCQKAGAWGSLLYDEPTIDCSSNSYKQALVLFVSILIFLVIAPLFLLSFLFYKHRVQIRHRVQMMHDSSCLSSAPAGASTEHSSLPYDSVRDESKVMMVDRNPTSPPPSSSAPSHARWLDHLDLLYGVYQVGYEQYALMILLRRFVLILIFVFAPIRMTFAWLTFANAVSCILHARFLPYQRTRDNLLEGFTLFALLLQTIVIDVYPLPWLVDVNHRGETGGGMNDVSAVLCILALIVLPLLCIFLSMCMDKFIAYRSRKQPLNAALELNAD